MGIQLLDGHTFVQMNFEKTGYLKQTIRQWLNLKWQSENR